MKKIILTAMIALGALTMNAQTRSGTSSGTTNKIAEFNKLVTVYTSGQRVDKAKLQSLYNEINCTLTEPQSEALNIDLATTREDICGSSEFPKTQTVSDDNFKKYAEIVKKYLDYGK